MSVVMEFAVSVKIKSRLLIIIILNCRLVEDVALLHVLCGPEPSYAWGRQSHHELLDPPMYVEVGLGDDFSSDQVCLTSCQSPDVKHHRHQSLNARTLDYYNHKC